MDLVPLDLAGFPGDLPGCPGLGGGALAVVQGGVATGADGQDLMSLAALYREPVWVLYWQGLKADRLSALKGRALSIGPKGSGVHTLATQLLAAHGQL